MDLPFDGGISAFYRDQAPDAVKAAIKSAKKSGILNSNYPYDTRWDKDEYEAELAALQVQLVRMQAWVRDTGQRVAIVFEGRDAAGKGGTIKRLRENLNPRVANVVALSKPTDVEAAQWYFQRYIAHLPHQGQITIFDRSWYNRGVVEHVFGFCTPQQRDRWFGQVPAFEQMLVDEGITLIKIWLNVGQATQLKRFLDREKDPLKQWKLSSIDVKGLHKWDAYSAAIFETFTRTHTDTAPWTIVRSDDKRRTRVQTIRHILHQLDYAGKDTNALGALDPKIVGGPDLWHV
ncbi:polyphosphate kinase 2, PA0141 family [Yoonia tamlensis]|uniref:ADP/GDP-polyphosphate phosphotransferase n=1 Tax=Yoonia tamlensis TaxID=390270 RepID=A0A1I6GAG9_9RHOB|nr:polyphosphate kinase 2 [Yoonia tamlensis]SFR39212.1 polyphosphate kinase 2, PA0141 family [Yoonia tamlensis]